MPMGKTLQLTLAIFKPDVVQNPHVVQEIRQLILDKNFYFIRSKFLLLTKQQAKEFYKEHDGKFFQNRLIHFMSSGPIWTHILARDNAIAEWRKMMGPTKVLKSFYEAPESIRGKHGLTDTRNCTHGSDSIESAARECKFFFPNFNSEKWYNEEEVFFVKKHVNFNKDLYQHEILRNNSEDVSRRYI